jgi:reversibly glycosylated polypeptide
MRPEQCAIVIPSCRTVTSQRLSHIPEGATIYVVSDTEAVIPKVRPGMQVFDLAFQRKVMGADFDLIPRHTSACRNFGFWYAWKHADHEFIISLDDDVEPGDGFLEGFAHLGQTRELDTATAVPWFNTMDLLEGCEGMYPRGFPFPERTGAAPEWMPTTARVVCHMGLWDGVLDTHAIDKELFSEYRLSRPAAARIAAARIGTRRSPTKFPLCSMNFGFTRDVLPLMYQMPMPAVFVDRYPLGRYEDILAGYAAQSLVALRDEALTAGAPVVRHLKEGSQTRELRAEHYGALLSPYFFGAIDEVVHDVRPAEYVDMYAQLSELVLTRGPALQRRLRAPAVFWEYIDSCFRAVSRWCRLTSVPAGGACARIGSAGHSSRE